MLCRVGARSNGAKRGANGAAASAATHGGGHGAHAASGVPMDALRMRQAEFAQQHSELLAAHHRHFHPIWGQMLKAGYQNSMYASLLERFACLYSSHVNNLILYSPYCKFRGRVDVMAHEQVGIAESERQAALKSESEHPGTQLPSATAAQSFD